MSYRGENGRDYEASGWWEIVDWKGIACDLYNARSEEDMLKAKKQFDEYWN